MQTNSDKIAALRRDITAQIVALMKDNKLEELELLEKEELDDPTYVMVLCNSGDWHESVVNRVRLVGDGIELHCSDEYVDAVLGSSELACNPLERLESSRQNILQTLGLPDNSDSRKPEAGCSVCGGEKENHDENYQSKASITLVGGRLPVLTVQQDDWAGRDPDTTCATINFCPFCGRKLTK